VKIAHFYGLLTVFGHNVHVHYSNAGCDASMT